MQTKRLGNSDLMVTPMCLGTMTFGEQNTEEQGHAQLDMALASGVNFIDTAELYPVMARAETYGNTERIVGSWLGKDPSRRQKIVLASKVAGPARGWDWIRGGSAPDKNAVISACEASLKRLQTDTIDLYQIHWPSRNVPVFGGIYFDPKLEREVPCIDELLEGMAQLVKEGKIRYVGLSNETPWGVMAFTEMAKARGLPYVASVQNAYNLLNRSIENGLDEVCFRQSVGILAYSPLAFGRLTGKYERGGFSKDGKPVGRLTHFPPTWSPRYMRPETVIATRRYVQLAKSFGMSTTHLALAFCLAKSCIASTIIGCTSTEQLADCLKATQVELSKDMLEAIDAVRWDLRDPAL